MLLSIVVSTLALHGCTQLSGGSGTVASTYLGSSSLASKCWSVPCSGMLTISHVSDSTLSGTSTASNGATSVSISSAASTAVPAVAGVESVTVTATMTSTVRTRASVCPKYGSCYYYQTQYFGFSWSCAAVPHTAAPHTHAPAVPHTAAPHTHAPAVPHTAAPHTHTPAVPHTAAPHTHAPAVPHTAAPHTHAPAVPHTAAPHTHAPAVPHTAAPHTHTPAVPHTAAPHTHAPAVPHTAAPHTHAPAVPHTAAPHTHAPAVPHTAAPHTHTPAVPHTAAPHTHAPAVPHTAAPHTHAPAVPHTAAPHTHAPAVPHTAAPHTHAPAVPHTAAPHTHTPAVPHTAAPHTHAPAVPHTAAPHTHTHAPAVPTAAPHTHTPAVPHTDVPHTSAPDTPTTVPSTTTPDTLAPTIAPDTPTTVPSTTTPDTLAPTIAPEDTTTPSPTVAPTALPPTPAPTAVPTPAPLACTASPLAGYACQTPAGTDILVHYALAADRATVKLAVDARVSGMAGLGVGNHMPDAQLVFGYMASSGVASVYAAIPTEASLAAVQAGMVDIETTAWVSDVSVSEGDGKTVTEFTYHFAAGGGIANTQAAEFVWATSETDALEQHSVTGGVVVNLDESLSTTNAPSTAVPTAVPTATPTAVPTAAPTAAPIVPHTAAPTSVPTTVPTAAPTAVPTAVPTAPPTAVPTATPTAVPTAAPTATPTAIPTAAPTLQPESSSSAAVVWCTSDAVCQEHGDTAATCEDNGHCTCSDGFEKPFDSDIGRRAHICVTSETKVSDVVHAAFDVACDGNSGKGASVGQLVADLVGGTVTDVREECGSLNMFVSVKDMPLINVAAMDVAARLSEKVKASDLGLGDVVSAGLASVDTLQCPTVAGVSQVFRNDAGECVPLSCSSGYTRVSTNNAFVCAVSTSAPSTSAPDSGSSGLSTGAIVGICVGGGVLLIAAVAAAVCLLRKKTPAGIAQPNKHAPDAVAHNANDSTGEKKVEV